MACRFSLLSQMTENSPSQAAFLPSERLGRLFPISDCLLLRHLDRLTYHAEVLTITGSSFRAQGRHRLLQEVPIEQPG